MSRSPNQSAPFPLTRKTFREAVLHLSGADPDLARVVSRFGHPPLRRREPGFPTLVLIILEQQVSLASARATFARLKESCNPLTPRRFLTFAEPKLKAIGFSRQKSLYCRELSKTIIKGHLDLPNLKKLDDSEAKARLLEMKGVGTWTADIYLMTAMLRPDIWPSGDLALAAATQEVKGLTSRPRPEELEEIAKPWRPWRTVAARILWHHYLSKRKGGISDV
jgi:DNA-3-methyladenine glycosylase II